MVRISIASLIYKSPKLADWVYESIHEFTPMIKSGEAEFFFVANDPTEKLLSHLKNRGYNFIEQYNKIYSDEEMFKMGYSWPEYIHRVYKGYNSAILHSKGEIIVLINSDHYFSPDWLENLLKYYDTQKIVCSQLIEPIHPKFGLFPSAIQGEFGNSTDSFNKDGFLDLAMRIKKTGLYLGGAYMPCMFSRDLAIYVGLYPEGNIAGESFNDINKTGDEAFFEKLSKKGILHITALDSVVYHLKEGEKDTEEEMLAGEDNTQNNSIEKSITKSSTTLNLVKTKNYTISIQPTIEHSHIITQLLNKGLKRRKHSFRGRIYKLLRKIYLLRLAKRLVIQVVNKLK
jgi:hypothetical protein